MDKITIIGLGLIGGSLGLALHRAKPRDVLIVGHSRRAETVGEAKRLGAVDKGELNLMAAVQGARMIIIATPIMVTKSILSHIAPHLLEGCVVTDTASTKTQVLRWAEETLPPTVSFVGGHPMAGKERSGIGAADATLFDNCVYCLCPPAKAPAEAVKTVVALVESVGASPFFIDPAEHDSFVAGISHLPLIVSAALVSTTAKDHAWKDMARMAASGYRDVSRLASTDTALSRDICATNQKNLVRWIDAYIAELQHFRSLIAEGGEELETEFEMARKAREDWLARPESTESASLVSVAPKEQLSHLFLGGLGGGIARKGDKGRQL
ncbi:MAG: prephenate dehydrogenase/arogenate dehydrogenase family protein [Chloroflexi bacterium]|nr:prephenate dehydrogenase/arogenate dehydrogenase family protein [Chloroflexota bacterium]